MVGETIHPIAFLVFPIAAVAATRRKRSVMLVVASIPFYSVVPLRALSHEFRVPEIAILALVANQLYRWLSTGTVRLPDHRSLYWLGLFIVTACVSVIAVALIPPNIITHPYNLGLDGFRLRPLQFSLNNVTQLFLRIFTVGAVVVLVTSVRETDFPAILRGILLGALLTGVLGVLYQGSILLGLSYVPAVFEAVSNVEHYFTFLGLGGYGHLQQMYTLAGEPGVTAQILLFALGIAVGFILVDEDTAVITQREAGFASALLFVFLMLTRASTAYGGLLILAVVAGAVFVFEMDEGVGDRLETIATITMSVIASLALLQVAGMDLHGMIVKQAAELTFRGASGGVRVQYFHLTFQVFSVRPFLGIGVGSYYSTSLVGTLLGEVGIVGFFSFGLAHVTAFFDCLSHESTKTDWKRGASLGLFIGGTTLLLTSLVARSISTLLTPWFWFALALPISFVWRMDIG